MFLECDSDILLQAVCSALILFSNSSGKASAKVSDLLEKPHPPKQCAGLGCMGKAGAASSMYGEVICKCLSDGDVRVREAAVKCFKSLGEILSPFVGQLEKFLKP